MQEKQGHVTFMDTNSVDTINSKKFDFTSLQSGQNAYHVFQKLQNELELENKPKKKTTETHGDLIDSDQEKKKASRKKYIQQLLESSGATSNRQSSLNLEKDYLSGRTSFILSPAAEKDSKELHEQRKSKHRERTFSLGWAPLHTHFRRLIPDNLSNLPSNIHPAAARRRGSL